MLFGREMVFCRVFSFLAWMTWSFDSHCFAQGNQEEESFEIVSGISKLEELLGQSGAVMDELEKTMSPHLGDWLGMEAFLGITWFKLAACFFLVILTIIVERLVRIAIEARERRLIERRRQMEWQHLLLGVLSRPLSLFICAYGIYAALLPLLPHFETPQGANLVHAFVRRAADVAAISSFIWLGFRLLTGVNVLTARRAAVSQNTFSVVLASLLKHSRGPLQFLIFLILVRALIPLLDGSPEFLRIVRDGFSLLFIGGVAWLVIRLSCILEDLSLSLFRIDVKDNLTARKFHTQIRFLRRLIDSVVIVVALASMLMVFDKVRQLGTSLLASAGIVGVVVGLAAQRSISNLLVGFQIAVTQPIRLDDVVIVENEWGRVEEITSTYAVIKIWDLRRLIVPLTYFTEKPFQNWTRVSADILGTVFLYVDYTVPVEAVRRELHRILQQSDRWDGKVWGLQVTGTTERAMELRALMSAADASLAWDLRCEVREKLIAFVQENFPEAFPKVRAHMERPPSAERLRRLND